MNKQNNTSNSTTVDLTNLTNLSTYGELKALLPSTGTNRVPGINQLRKKAVRLLIKETASGTIEFFDNGFFIFMECDNWTVYGVDRCEWPSTYTEDGKGGKQPQDFSRFPWELILESAGSARLAHNGESREEYQGAISIDAPESENNIALSVRPEHEIKVDHECTDQQDYYQDVKECSAPALQFQLVRDELIPLPPFVLVFQELVFLHLEIVVNI